MSEFAARGLVHLGHLGTSKKMGCPGLEPGTFRLRADCSVIELATRRSRHEDSNPDGRFTRPLLYPLSYIGTCSGQGRI